MRHALIWVSIAAALFAVEAPANAQGAPWCSTKDGLSCGYFTFQQCLDAIRGVGGSCIQNPRGAGSYPGGIRQGRTTVPGGQRARQELKARQERAIQEQRARAQQKARQEQRARQERAIQEQRSRQAAPPKEQRARPPVTTVAPETPATPATPPSVAATPPALNNPARKSAPLDARVYFVSLQDGAEIPSTVTILFGVVGMGVAPAGISNPNTGHHHLLIDTKLPNLDLPIPNDFNHLHFGAGQTEATVTLPPGKRTLQLLLADENHVPHSPAVMSGPITVFVKAAR